MKQVLARRGRVGVINVPAPLITPGYVLVEVAYSLISTGTERATVQADGGSLLEQAANEPSRLVRLANELRKSGIKKTVALVRQKLAQDKILGYSCSGRVIQVGEDIDNIRPGDIVACAGGGLAVHAELVLVPLNLIVQLPEGCDLKSAASVALGAIAVQGVRRADPRLGEYVGVIGLGFLGQITSQILSASGCRVIGLEIDERRASLARELGAEHTLLSSELDVQREVSNLTQGYGLDCVIITASSASDDILQQAMNITRRKGRVVIVGAVGLGLQRSPFYEKEIDLLISCSYGPGRYDDSYELNGSDYPYDYVRWTENRNMAEYLRLVTRGQIQLTPLFEREYDVVDADLAYESLFSDTNSPIAVMLRYSIAPSGEPKRAKLETKVELRSNLPVKPLRIAIVGGGSFATKVHLPNLRELSDVFHIRAIVSKTGSNAKSLAEQFGADYATTDLSDVLSDCDTDAVLISTRHHLHASQTVAALMAGKHVYLEKPLCLSQDELVDILACYNIVSPELVDEIPTVGRMTPVLMVGYNRRFSPALERLKKVTRLRKGPMVMTYRVNASYLPPAHWTHGYEGGGRILGEGCHMFDVFTYLVGHTAQNVNVQPIRSRSPHILPSDNSSITIGYSDGSVGTLVYTSLGSSESGKECLEVFVDGKTLVIDDYKNLTVFGVRNKNWRSRTGDKGHKRSLLAFANSVMSEHLTWPIPLIDLVDVARVTLAVADQVNRQ